MEPVGGLSTSLAKDNFYVGNASGVATATPKSSIPLSGFASATADVAMGNFKISGLGTPTNPTDAATKAYVDANGGGWWWWFYHWSNAGAGLTGGGNSGSVSLGLATNFSCGEWHIYQC